MTTADHQTKIAQFDEFFSINYTFNINASVIDLAQLPNYQQFIENMPAPFKIAAEVNTADENALRALQAVTGVSSPLMDYLKHQAKKMDLLVGYILSQENDASTRYQAIKFGGGGIIFKTTAANLFNTGDFLELKLFFADENTALYCFGEIVSNEIVDSESQYKVIFHHIRVEDQEALVRHSLHQQSKQLQALAQQRHQAKNTSA
jgi:hypothetical protein